MLSQLILRKEERRQQMHNAVSEGGPPIFLLLHGAHQMEALRNDPFPASAGKGSAEPNPARMLEELLRSGPDVGIHVVMICDRFANYSQSIDPNRRLLRAFDLRIGLQMSADDSNVLLSSQEAARLGPLAALFYHAGHSALLKFRPFQMPDPAWVKSVLSAL